MDSAGLHIHLAISPDGSLLAAGASNGKLTLWNTSTWEQVVTLPASSEAVVGLAFTPDGKFIVTGTADGAIRFWAVRP